MKKLLIICSLIALTGCTQTSTTPINAPATLTIYTYDSLAADYGLLPKIQPEFETANNVKLNIVSFPDTGAMMNQLVSEQSDPQADLVLGMDNTDLARFDNRGLFYDSTAFDYSYVDFVYDSEAIQFDQPISLEALVQDPAYKNKIIIEQPGLSSPGTQLLLWSQAVFGDDTTEFWQALHQQVLTVTPDWNTAYYSLFLNGEAPIVLSYVTSPAYHLDQEGTDRYRAVPISDGYLKQTEYVAITRDDHTTLAQQFIYYLLTDSVQNQIATTQWMFPIQEDATVPAAYDQLIQPTPDQLRSLTDLQINSNYTTWLNQWNGIFGQ